MTLADSAILAVLVLFLAVFAVHLFMVRRMGRQQLAQNQQLMNLIDKMSPALTWLAEGAKQDINQTQQVVREEVAGVRHEIHQHGKGP